MSITDRPSRRGLLVRLRRLPGTDERAAVLANLRLLLDEGQGVGEIYGKVVGLVEGAPERVRVRFTSLDPATRLRLAEIASAG